MSMNSVKHSSGTDMTHIGVLGVGTISSALITGFLTDPGSASRMHFYLSPRNAQKAAKLGQRFPEHITICDSNQDVVDASERVFLTVLPRDGEAVISPLSFRPEQKILTIMSDHPVERVLSWTGEVAEIVRMVPLPFAAMHIGPIAIYPANAGIREMFAPLGDVIELDEQNELSVISAQTAIMSAFYHLIYDTVSWGTAQGLPKEASLRYMTSFYEALSVKARGAENGDVRALAYEMTPGGLNEMALKSILAGDGFRIWTKALDEVMERLKR